jgi:hypothetical protein
MSCKPLDWPFGEAGRKAAGGASTSCSFGLPLPAVLSNNRRSCASALSSSASGGNNARSKSAIRFAWWRVDDKKKSHTHLKNKEKDVMFAIS